MNINKEERSLMISALKNEIKRLPYAKELRDLLKKVEQNEPSSTKANVDYDKARQTQFLINMLHDAGIFYTNDANFLNSEDAKRAADFLAEIIRFDRVKKEFYENICNDSFDSYSEFEPHMDLFCKEIIELDKRIKKSFVREPNPQFEDIYR